LPAGAGIGLRAPHEAEFLALRPPLALVEVHTENAFGGGHTRRTLRRLRESHALSLHGVGLSLGSTDPLCARHLAAVCALVRELEPALVSEHLSFGAHAGVYANDLLPLPLTQEALDHLVPRVQQVQDSLRRPILIENISAYLVWQHAEMSEPQFLAELARRSGCGLLLDVNNLHVNVCNHGGDPIAWLQALPADAVHEMHLAGHVLREVPARDGGRTPWRLDTHSRPVDPAVWALYDAALRIVGPRPTVIEWDADLPPLATLLAEASIAERHLVGAGQREADHAC
jgi:uncharacterized protein (UPF0276 family)